MDDSIKQHAATIERMLAIPRSRVLEMNLNRLLDGILDGDLTVDDVLQFTSLQRVELNDMLTKRSSDECIHQAMLDP